MAKVFATTTTVWDEETGRNIWFAPGDECPKNLESVVNNPAAFMQEDVDDFTQGVDYHSMTVPQLVELCKTRELDPPSTKKSELVATLEEAENGAGD